MLKLCVLFAVFVVIRSNSIPFDDILDNPTITTNSGQVQGERLSCGLFCNYFSFKGIPYAAPPVGDLRFRGPVPHPGWEGVRQATQHGQVCPQGSGGVVIGDEDCLFLNIYTQDLIGSRPVMLFIHGGSFVTGSGNSDVYGPDYFVQEGVLLVTINYRLGMLGHLNTGDRFAQGNYALKDMVEALRWVRDNIAGFGGNPNNVTIFGESAGAAAVHYLILSQMSTGLFHRAIAQSSTVISPYAFQPNPRDMAFEFAENAGVSTVTSEALVDELRELTFAQIVANGPATRPPSGLRPYDFVPSIEGEDFVEPRFLTLNPFDILRSGDYNHVPLIMGFNDAETLYTIRSPLPEDEDETFVPILWNVTPNTAAFHEVAMTFRDFYWNDAPLTPAVSFNYMEYTTDHIFVYGIDKCVQIHAENQEEDVFYYQFAYDGALNGFKIRYDVQMYPGATHADELFYMFLAEELPVIESTNTAYVVRSRMVRMWTNFAKYSHPTFNQDNLITVDWSPVQGGQEYLNIDVNLTPTMSPRQARLNLWKDLEARFANF